MAKSLDVQGISCPFLFLSDKVWSREWRIACYSFLNPAKMCYNSTNLLEYMKVLENFHVFLAKEVEKVCIQMIV